jgi:hypothetical protein
MFLSTLRFQSCRTFPILRMTTRKKIAPVTRLPSFRFHSTQDRVSSDTTNLQKKFNKFKNLMSPASLFYNARQERRKESLQQLKVGTPVQLLFDDANGLDLIEGSPKKIYLGKISSRLPSCSVDNERAKLEVSFDNGNVSTYEHEELNERIKESHKWKEAVLDKFNSSTTVVSDIMNCGPLHWKYTFLRAVPLFFKSSIVGIGAAGVLFQTFDPTFGLICGAGHVGNIVLHELGHRWAAQMCGYRSSCVIMNPPCVLIPESGMYANPTKEMIIYMAGPLVGGIGAIAIGISGIIMHSTGMETSGAALTGVAMFGCLNNVSNGMPTISKNDIEKERDKERDGNRYRKAMNEQYENESKRHLRPGLAVLKYIFAAGCATSLCGVLFLFCLLFVVLLFETWNKNKEARRKFFEDWKLKIDQSNYV